MKRPRTLRARIALFFCGYLAVLLTIYSYSLIGSFRIAEDLTFTRQLSEITAGILQHIEAHGEMPDVLPAHISAYMDPANVPTYLQEHVKDRESGIFEAWDDNWSAHIHIVPLAPNGHRLFVVYDVGSIESSEQLESIMKLVLAMLGFGILLLGWILARSLSNRIITPVTDLAAAVQALPLDKGDATLRFNSTPDEVGTLADTIDHLLKRISEFTRREREFTSHASHELRTPVTVIKGAMEILKSRSDAEQTAIRRPLARIEHAVTDMELLIDTFLMLARQRRAPDHNETCDMREIIEKVVSSHEYLLVAKPVQVAVRAEDPRPLKAPGSMVTIALGNLVRNAFQYTMEGRIDIIALPDRVRIIDSGPGIGAAGSRGSGLGLVIIERLCEHMNWRFNITSEPDEGTCAELVFSG